MSLRCRFYCCLFALFSPLLFAQAPPTGHVPDHYIIKLNNAGQARAVANDHAVQPRHVYRYAYHGFAARVPEARLKALRDDPRVSAVYKDRFVAIAKPKCDTPPCGGGGGDSGGEDPPPPSSSQIVPTGIQRIFGSASGIVNVDVAVIDTGIASHRDLNVVGGINCNNGRPNKWQDGNGHGTHVAGTIAAIDNDHGVIGVAPGARLHAVRVLNNAGSGFLSDVICGIDWVTENAHTIEVANMSLGGSGNDNGGCSSDPEHEAICALVDAGVTVVVAAGNDSDDAANHRPAAYDEVITVSALADFDGAPGGTGSPTCRNDEDDSFANFSNYGEDVDIIAPGVCIESTWNDGGTAIISGTSMASPHVAGAAALYLSSSASAIPSEVKAALLNKANKNWDNSDDGDFVQEPLLDVSSF